MTHNLPSFAPVSELELAALAAAAVPGMQIRQIRGELVNAESGQWLRLVDAGGGQWLAWAPSAHMDAATMDRYGQVLEVLSTASTTHHLPWASPWIAGSVNREGGGSVLVMQYPGGDALRADDLNSGGLLPSSVGSALAALHELPPAAYKAACRRYADSDLTRKALRSLVERHSAVIPLRLRSRWVDALKEDSLWGFDPVPLHGSLGAANVFAADGAVVGMTRFDQAAVGDPAADLVWLMYYASDDFLSVFEESYAMNRTVADLHLLTRAQLLSEMETLRWYGRGFAANDEQWCQQGAQALRDLDDDIGDQRLVPHRPEVVEITFGVEDEPLLKLHGPGPRSGPSDGRSNYAEDTAGKAGSSGGPVSSSGAEDATDVLSLPSDATGPYDPFAMETPQGRSELGTSFEDPSHASSAEVRSAESVNRPLRRRATGSIEVP